MQFSSLSFVALALGLAAANPIDLLSTTHGSTTSNFALEARQRTLPNHCSPQFHLMVASGCALPCAADTPNFMAPLIDTLLADFPLAHAWFVPYNGSETQGMVSTPRMESAVTNFAASCPNTPIVMLGYSLGGIIIMNTLCGGVNPALSQNNIIAAAVFGEETYVGGQVYDKSTCTNNAPMYPRSNTAACQPFAPVLQSYCTADDPDCCAGGTNQSAHFAYFSEFDTQVVSYVSAQYSSYRLVHPSTATVTAASTATSTTASVAASTTA